MVGVWSYGLDTLFGRQYKNYSDFTSYMNSQSNGWYSTLVNMIPFVNNAHNAVLGHDEQQDYIDNNDNVDWSNIQGYNASKINYGISNNLASLTNGTGQYLQNIGNDLGKLYSGQQPKKPVTTPLVKQKYSSKMMDAW